jgi:two-component system, cell cycle response regulator DivK
MISVLLVEPHADTRDLYTEFLEYSGLRARAVATIDEAWRFVPDADIVVTEIQVSCAFDGLEFVRRLRATVTARRLPVIIVSGCAFQRDASEADDAGADLFLTKPCLPDELVASIRRVLRAVRARRMLRATPTARHRRQV